MTETPEKILSDLREEAASIGAEVLAAGIAARLLGGMAIWLRCPSVREGQFARSYNDMDFVVSKADSARLRAMIEARGYLPDKFFNGLHGATRLYYGAPDGRWSIDIVIDELSMSHHLDLRGQLTGPQPTVNLADLLLTKLQVFHINHKGLGDTLCLLADHGVSESGSDPDAISLPRLASVLGRTGGSAIPSRGTSARCSSCGPKSRSRRPRMTFPARSGRSRPPSRRRPRRWPGGCAAGSASGSAGTRRPRKSATRLIESGYRR